MHVHTDSSLLPVLWLSSLPPLLAAAVSMGAREGGCGPWESPSIPHTGGGGKAHPSRPGHLGDGQRSAQAPPLPQERKHR